MEVIFQDDEGLIESIVGAEFATAKVIVDLKRKNALLMWFEDSVRACWYRIYLDDFICGIDRYAEDESEADENTDDDYTAMDHSEWFEGKGLVNAAVESSHEGDDACISLTFQFDDKSSMLLHHTKDDDRSKLRFVEQAQA